MGWSAHGMVCPCDGLPMGWSAHVMVCPWDGLLMVCPCDGLPVGWSAHGMVCVCDGLPMSSYSCSSQLLPITSCFPISTHTGFDEAYSQCVWPFQVPRKVATRRLDVCVPWFWVSCRYTGLLPPPPPQISKADLPGNAQRTVPLRDRLVQHATKSVDPSALSTHRRTKRIRNKATAVRSPLPVMSSILPCPPCLLHGGVQWGRGRGQGAGEGGKGGGAGDISSTLPLLHYHMVLRPEGTSHKNTVNRFGWETH